MIRKTIFISVILLLLASSCSKYQRLLKSEDYEEKYQMAMVFYEQANYDKALQLFDQLLPYYRGSDRAERLSYYYANAHYYQQDYELASFYFKRFSKTFPKSKFAEECSFMSAYCKYLDSPRHTLDQTSTLDAIQELQLFINTNVQSERIGECNRLIDDLRAKLELKEMNIARLYYKMEDYTAAITAFKNILKDYPETQFREEIMIGMLRSQYNLAINSVEIKKEDRLNEALASYDNFTAQFPQSQYANEAKGMQKSTLRMISQVNNK